MTKRGFEVRLWNVVTEEKLWALIYCAWPTKKFINQIKEISMGDDKGSHSDPYPKMPWESGDGGGSHRAGGQGCFSMVSVPVVVVLCLLALMVECIWW